MLCYLLLYSKMAQLHILYSFSLWFIMGYWKYSSSFKKSITYEIQAYFILLYLPKKAHWPLPRVFRKDEGYGAPTASGFSLLLSGGPPAILGYIFWPQTKAKGSLNHTDTTWHHYTRGDTGLTEEQGLGRVGTGVPVPQLPICARSTGRVAVHVSAAPR